MSMIMCLDTASDRTIEQLLSDTDAFNAWHEAGDAEETTADSDERVQVDLDKAWHAIHFLLCGSAYEGDGPTAFLLAGGAVIEGSDMGYGPARAFRSKETAHIHSVLSTIPPETLRARFNAKALTAADIYPSIWEEDPGSADYVLGWYEALLDHLSTAVAKRTGMVVYLT